MKKIVKQVAAIDVGQKELVVCLGRMYDDWAPELYAHKTFTCQIWFGKKIRYLESS